MKALIRKKGETITEDMDITWIDWITGMPLTNPDWAGGPYTLVENYIPSSEDEHDEITVSVSNAERIAEINELKARLATLENDL